MEVPVETPLKLASEFQYIGKHFPRIDAIAKSTGTAEFDIDVDIPGMHHAVVRRSVPGAKLKSVDKSEALAMPGVTDVVEISSGVGVVAEKYWQAKMAAQKLAPQWEEVALSKVDTKTIQADYNRAMAEENGVNHAEDGDVAAGFADATHTAEAGTGHPIWLTRRWNPSTLWFESRTVKPTFGQALKGIGAARGLVSRFSGIAAEKNSSNLFRRCIWTPRHLNPRD